MLDTEKLTALLHDLESDRVERTVATNDTDKFSKAVCAFANDMPRHRGPGYLLVGIDDRERPAGLKVSDGLLQNLAALRSDGNILPLPAITVSKHTLPAGNEVAVVEVLPSDLPPVRYKGQVWIRVGPRRAIASEQEERVLTERRVAGTVSFDASALPPAKVDDLSLAVFSGYRETVVAAEVISENHRTMKEQLASLRCYDLDRDCATVAGVLLFGRRPRHFLPGAYTQYLRLGSTTLTEVPVDQAEVAGDLLTVLRELDVRIRSNLHTALVRDPGGPERTVSDYPEVAVRELLFNAVLHRDYAQSAPIRFYWYADRVEILSPGGLYGGVTPETLTRRSGYRNPVIAEAMKGLGYVNRFGYGIQRAQAALAQNGNPPAEFDIDDAMVRVVLRARGAS